MISIERLDTRELLSFVPLSVIILSYIEPDHGFGETLLLLNSGY